MMKPGTPRPLLDRFFPGGGPDGLDGYADIVLRDAEALLNTRAASFLGDGEESLGAYGLPDLTAAGRTEGDLSRLAWRVRDCLAQYEPRLNQIQVEALPPAPGEIDRLTVHVTAALAGFEKGPVLSLELPLPVGLTAG